MLGSHSWVLPSIAFIIGKSGTVNGHGAMLLPPPRNAIDTTLPGVNWGNGTNETGVLERLHVYCANGTDPNSCHPGQSAFWFSQGCTPGCTRCDHNGTRMPNWDHCADTRKSPYVPTLDPKYRSANRNATPGSVEDIWKYQPWRSPGLAPVDDPCGMAGGSPIPVFNGGEYTTTKYAKQGDLGTKVLQPRPTGIVWNRGGVANVSWYIAFNHGGGYSYRLCPRTEPLTEECFQKNQLQFASTEHTVLFSSGAMKIPNTIVKTGGGIGWMLSPIPMPNFVGSQCDNGKGYPCGGCGFNLTHSCGSYPGGNTEKDFPNPFGVSNKGKNTAILDQVHVPDVPPGDYVVGFRWDCETSSQVWLSCGDITIV